MPKTTLHKRATCFKTECCYKACLQFKVWVLSTNYNIFQDIFQFAKKRWREKNYTQSNDNISWYMCVVPASPDPTPSPTPKGVTSTFTHGLHIKEVTAKEMVLEMKYPFQKVPLPSPLLTIWPDCRFGSGHLRLPALLAIRQLKCSVPPLLFWVKAAWPNRNDGPLLLCDMSLWMTAAVAFPEDIHWHLPGRRPL